MIEPLKDNVIVRPIENHQPVYAPSGILLPDRSASDDHFGIVRFIGPDVKALKPGDVIIMPTWNDEKLEVDGKKYIVLAEKSISVRISK